MSEDWRAIAIEQKKATIARLRKEAEAALEVKGAAGTYKLIPVLERLRIEEKFLADLEAWWPLVWNDGERILGRVNGLLAAHGALWIRIQALPDGMIVRNALFMGCAVWASHYWFHETVVAMLATISFHVARGATNLNGSATLAQANLPDEALK